MLFARNKAKKPKPRLSVRKLFEGTILREDNREFAVLSVKKGAHRTVVDKFGDVVSSSYDAGCVLWANIGDRLLLTGPTLDEVANTEILAIRQDMTIRVQFLCGDLKPDTTSVRVLVARSRA